MSWRTIKVQDVFDEMTDTEVDMLKNIQSGPDGAKMSSMFTKVVLSARGAILTGGNQIDSDETKLPDQVISDVVTIARWKWLTSFPLLKSFQTPARETAANKAQERLDKIADGKLPVEAPVSPSTAETPIAKPAFGTRTRNFNSASQDG